MGVVIPQVITEDRASSAQVIDGSLKFDSGATNYLKKTPYVGNRKTWTISFWVKRSEGTSNEPGIFSTFAGSNPAFTCYFNAQDKLRIYDYTSSYIFQLTTDQVFRDYNSWYHIVISIDTTQTTASDRVKLYVNGVRVTDFDTATESYPGLNVELDWNTAYEHNIGKHSNEFDGNLSNFYHIDGHSFGPEYFGFTDPLTNTWRPKKLEQFPKRSFTNPRWYSSATVYTSVADVVANATDRGNGGVTVTNEYCYLVFNDGGYGTSGGEYNSPDYPVWTDVASFSGTTRVFYYDSNETDNWKNAASYSSAAGEWNQWRYSNSATEPASLAYRISPYMGIENGNMLVFCADTTSDNPTNAGTLASITLPTFDTNSFHFQNAVVDTWYTGGNSFYLPFDGNSPIGKDRFNNKNDWTPVNFSGSNTIEKATGALPILNTISGGKIATVGVRTDAFANNLVLALPLVDTTTDVSGIINSGTTSKTIAGYENAAPASDGQGMFYGVSVYLDGSNDHVETSNSDDFVVGTGDFTIEAWYNVAATQGTNSRLFAQNVNDDNNWDCYLGGSFGTSAIMMHGGSVDLGMSFPTANAWHHFCIARKNGILYSFMNGVLKNTQTYTNSVGVNNHGFRVGVIGGSGGSTGYGLQGYVQDFRFYKGVAKYTSDFIPASTNPDILPDTPSGISGSSKLTKITEGAVTFDGTDDYLEIADNTDFELGTGDFTIEAFIYNSVDAVQSVITKYDNGDTTRSFWLGTINLNNVAFYWYSGSNVYAINGGAGTLPTNKWTHVVAQRTSGDIYLFVDGKVVSSNTGADAAVSLNDTTYALRIGSDTHEQGLEFEGFISNVRIVKGTGVYNTSGFTPPTEPLTNVTNTKLLCCQSNKLAGTAAVSPNISGGLNDGTVWSDYLTTTQGTTPTDFYYDAYPAAFLFDGDTSNPVYGGWINDADDSSDLIFRPPSGISVSSKLEVYAGYYTLIKVNGSNYNTGAESTAPAWVTVSDGSNFTGTLTELILENTSNSNVVRASAIRIDDSTILLDPVTAKAGATTFNPFNTDINTVRGQETSYCTWNPLGSTTYTLSNGNLDASFVNGSNNVLFGTIGVTSNKWYWEVTPTSGTLAMIGIVDLDVAESLMNYGQAGGLYMYQNNGGLYGQMGGSFSATTYGTATSIGDVVGVALDMDNGNVTFYKNGISFGVANTSTLVGKTIAPGYGNGGGATTTSTNFGQKPFKFPPPDGFQPLNAANIRPETVIARPDQYVGVTTYAGTAATQSIGDFSFKPDLVWIKATDVIRSNMVFDTVRGAEKYLISDTNAGQVTDSTSLTSFDSNGFTVGTSADVNRNTSEIVAWCWKAGGQPDTDLRCTTRMTGDVYPGEGSYDNLFDGSVNDGGTYAMADPSLTWSPTNWTEANSVTSFRISATRYNRTNAGGTLTVVHSGGTVTIDVNSAQRVWHDVYVTGTTNYVTDIQSVTWTKAGNAGSSYIDYSYVLVFGFEINGTVVTNTSCGAAPALPYYVDGVGYATTTAAGLTNGSNTITGASIGTKQGFSIISYDGSDSGSGTLDHGLSQAPDFFIFKRTNDPTGADDWLVGHSSEYSYEFKLGVDGDSSYNPNTSTSWGSGPDNNVFTFGAHPAVNGINKKYICYSWHNVPGLQKFGRYTANNDANGPFVHLGFKPAILVIKKFDGAGDWMIYDPERHSFNVGGTDLGSNTLWWNSSSYGNGQQQNIDILSNGFKIRSLDYDINQTPHTYLYCAWAKSPSVNLYGGQSNAR